MPATDPLPVTVVVSRRPRPGHEQALTAWAEGITEAAAAFPGHLGAQVHPPRPPEQPDLVLVFSFATAQDLLAWEASPQRAAWIAKAEPLAEGPQVAHAVTGFEALLGPGHRAPVIPPPRWKTAMVIALALYPLSLLVNWLLGPVLAPLPLPLRGLVTTALLVPAMTWWAVPTLSRWLRRWLNAATR